MSPTVIFFIYLFLTWSTFVGYKHHSTPSPTKMAFGGQMLSTVLRSLIGAVLSIWECFEQFCKLLHARQLTKHAAAAAKHTCQQVQVRGELEMEVCCTLLLWCAKDVAEKNDPHLTATQNEYVLLFSRPAVTVALFHPRFFSFFFWGGLFPSALRGGLRLTGRGPAPRELAAGWRGLFLSGGVKYRPVRHPDGADSHSGRAEEFLPAVKGLFHWRQACHQGGAELAVSATGRHSRYHLPLPFKSPAKSGSLVKSATPPWSPLPLPFSQSPPIKVWKLIWLHHLTRWLRWCSEWGCFVFWGTSSSAVVVVGV